MIDISEFSRQVYSQRGEDGMIECVLKELEIDKGWCCEFGAWDGKHLSNVYKLITEEWNAVLIEGDKEKYADLLKNMYDFPRVCTHNSYVSLESGQKLDEILNLYVKTELDVLSIDIDSYDYWVWKSLVHKPKLVVIEYNSNWKESVTVPYDINHKGWAGNSYFGASATALRDLGEKKGYDLIGFQPYTNLFFLRKDLNKERFKIHGLSREEHIQTPHHGPLTEEQKKLLVYSPPLG